MSLAAGTRLGPYEIVEPIGKGGMGEVYRARDTKLDRDVAIKVLPDELSADEERVARFEREAKLLASLNHPNIASIYGFESGALVLEMVEGPTLAERIEGGPVPLDEALPIAKQIAEALEAGHEAGVIHRDLKPANIKLKEDGTVKVLDYGLAKALEGDAPDGVDAELSQSPTLTRQGTQVGVILGTAAYMSPEQAKGKPVDKRTDIWAFGVVVFEMLTGRRAFGGDDVSETLASVIKSEPDWAALPGGTSESLRRVLRLCLTKNVTGRFRDIADAQLAIGAFDIRQEESPSSRGWRHPVVIAAASAVLFSIVTWAWTSRVSRSTQMPRPVVRSLIPIVEGAAVAQSSLHVVALSPDGHRIVYRAQGQLYLRAMSDAVATPIRGTEGAQSPAFSPDGEWIAFLAQGRLMKVATGGGEPVGLSDVERPFGIRWDADDTIVVAERGTGILRVSADGGAPEALVSFPEMAELAHAPQILPGGRAVLFTLAHGDDWAGTEIVVESLETKERTVLIERGADARYVDTGHLVYVREGTLLAAPFDVDELALTGNAAPIIEGVAVSTVTSMFGQFSVSDTGSLIYLPQMEVERDRRLAWVDRDGREETIAIEPGRYADLRLSPDGTRVALGEDQEIWVWDFERETLARLTFSPAVDMKPMWTPDGKRVAFGSARAGIPNMYWKSADGTGDVEPLNENPRAQFPQSFTPDGTRLVFWNNIEGSGGDLWLLSVEGGAEPLLTTESNDQNAVLSLDGRYLAYQSNESGQNEVYVRPFPELEEGLWLISKDGGSQPVWAKDGRELFYIAPGSKLMAMSVETEPVFRPGTVEELFSGYYEGGIGRKYDVSPDGERFLVIKNGPSREQEAFILVQNWFEELERLVPTER